MWWRRWFGQAATDARAHPPLLAVAPLPQANLPEPVDSVVAAPTADPPPPLAELHDRFNRFVLGLPPPEASLISALELATLRRVEALTERFDVRSLPRLPVVLPQLLRALKHGQADGAQLARLIGRDPVLVGEVMRVTASPLYRTAQPISSVQHAVVLLGQEGLRRIATQHVMKPILQASAGMRGHLAGPHLWEHAERCAHASAYLGRTQACDPFEAYLAGMVSHAGTGAVVRLLDQEAPLTLGSCSADFLARCMQLGARLSVRAVQQWELPANVILALRERADNDDAPLSVLGKALLCGQALGMAQLLAERGLLDADADYSHQWPERFSAPLLLRCKLDLRRQFGQAHVI